MKRAPARVDAGRCLRAAPAAARVSALLAALLWGPAPARADITVLTASVAEPRAYGYSVGDLMQRVVTILVPPGLALDADSLPGAGGRGRALELRQVEQHAERHDGGQRIVLRLQYQVFLAPREVRTLEMPPVVLRFRGTPRVQELRVDAWPVTVAPLVPVEVSPRRGLGDWQPDAPPPLFDTAAGRLRLGVYAALAALLLAYLGWVYVGLPWQRDRQRPFTRAWRELRGLSGEVKPERRRAAYRHLHAALNASAGEVVFEHGVDRFLSAQPQFQRWRADLLLFFARSRAEFFAAEAGDRDGAAASDDAAWLVEFGRHLRDAERGAA